MKDQIHIRDLFLRTIIGVNEQERRERQDVLINIALDVELAAAQQHDDIELTVNYRTLTKQVVELVEQSQFHLVETLAAEIASLCLRQPLVVEARVTVDKPGALRFARSVGVTVTRARTD